MQALKDRDPKEFAGLVVLYEMAIQQVNNPDYERVAPPRRIKHRVPLLMLGALSALSSVLNWVPNLHRLNKRRIGNAVYGRQKPNCPQHC